MGTQIRQFDDIIVYDVEIIKPVNTVPGGWDNPEEMGFACAVAYIYSLNAYQFYYMEEGRQELMAVLDGNLAVSFNGIQFDSRVLGGNARAVHGEYVGIDCKASRAHYGWHNYDLLLEFVKSKYILAAPDLALAKLSQKDIHDGSFSLDALAGATINKTKIGKGVDTPILLAEKKLPALFEYNLHDVRITRSLFEFVVKYGYVIDGHGSKYLIHWPYDHIIV